MALIIEDGTIVPGANTYVGDAEFQAYADERGIELPVDASERESLLILGSDYIDTKYRNKFQGCKITRTQSMQWPRYDVCIDGFPVPSSEIPIELKTAQIEAAISSIEQDLYTDSDGTSVKKEKLDVLEIEYFEGGSSGQPTAGKVKGTISPLLIGGGRKKLLRT